MTREIATKRENRVELEDNSSGDTYSMILSPVPAAQGKVH